MSKKVLALLFIFTVFDPMKASSQPAEVEYYNAFSFDLHTEIDQCARARIKEATKPNKYIEIKNYHRSARYLSLLVNQGVFIKYDSMERYLLSLFDRIEEANHTGDVVKRVLIINSTETNAFSVGIKVISVTMGLLAQMKSENELMAVLAHEMAHELKGHSRIDAMSKSVLQDRSEFKKLIKEMSELDLTPDMIRAYQEEAYRKSKSDRQLETEADTVSIRLLKAASYSGESVLTISEYFEEGYYPSYQMETRILFSPFYFNAYPFRSEWLLLDNVEHVDPKTFLFFNLDSLATHPSDKERIQLNSTLIDSNKPDTIYSTASDFLHIQEKFLLYYYQQLIKKSQYDLAFHLLLYLYHHQPTDFVKLEIAKMLVKLSEVQNTSEFLRYVAVSDDHYPTDLKYINAFLHNSSKQDKLWLAYYFLNRAEVFNKKVEEYYTLLLPICDSLGRLEVKRRVEAMYRENFPK